MRFLVLSVLLFPAMIAKGSSGLVINEVMTNNTNSIIDINGERSSWFEIYNDSEAPVSLAGCFITNDANNKRLYTIRKGERLAKLDPHQRVIVFCNGVPGTSLFHTNFKLNPERENYLALISANGIDVIDEVNVPILNENQSWGLAMDGDKETKSMLQQPTPLASNYFEVERTSVEKFKEKDPFGIGMAITAMGVVFTALLTLFLSFKLIGKISIMLTTRRARKAAGLPIGAEIKHETSGEVFAAIAMALKLHEDDAHDYEDTVLTLKTVEKRYSPWSSKLYGLRENPKK